MSRVWAPAFPSADLVSAAASMLTGYRLDDRALGITLGGVDMTKASAQVTRRFFPEHFDRLVPQGPAGASHWPRVDAPTRFGQQERELVEGPRWRIMVGPGVVSVRSTDPARAERAYEVVERKRWLGHIVTCSDDACTGCQIAPQVDRNGGALITGWSPKSRNRMAEVFASLDWSPMFTDPTAVPAMITLTYPGDWLAVAPCAAESRRHVLALRKRFERAWGVPMIGVWKREFQRRGAPHYHFLMVPPHGRANGLTFREWLSETWASIVGSECCGVRSEDSSCCERHRHIAAGTGIDYAEGLRARDPRSIGVYFAKHGSFVEKEYQNHAPDEWVDQGSVGRFWGVWGLSRAVAGVEVHPTEALAAARVLRRMSRANSYEGRREVWRYRTVVDRETGEVRARWRRSTKKVRVYHFKRDAGYLVVPDGPALVGAIARHLDRLRRPESVVGRSGAGPIGFLP